MKSRHLLGISILLFNLILAGCSGADSRPEATPVVITPKSLQSELAVIQSIEPQLAKLDTEFAAVPLPAREDARRRHPHLYAARTFLFKSISRLKNPTAHIIEFTDQQKQEIFNQLQPGDLILTYTAGYMSDVFIPGAFKHGIIYIGSKEERGQLDLNADVLPGVERYEPQQLTAHLENSVLADGTEADMIEAVAEGVIFNDLEHIMDTHINRMLVLRPKLDLVDRKKFLVEVYSYLGDAYDFEFDFILLVETDPATKKSALIYTGEVEEKLKVLMESVEKSKGSG